MQNRFSNQISKIVISIIERENMVRQQNCLKNKNSEIGNKSHVLLFQMSHYKPVKIGFSKTCGL